MITICFSVYSMGSTKMLSIHLKNGLRVQFKMSKGGKKTKTGDKSTSNRIARKTALYLGPGAVQNMISAWWSP